MSSGKLVNFESAWEKAKEREEIRDIRETILQKAKTKSEWNQKRKDQEDSWMLPELGKKLKLKSSATKEKKSKKPKKKSKKKKSKKSKKKDSSSDSEEDSSENEWVEKKPDKDVGEEEKESEPEKPERQSWMNLAENCDPFANLLQNKNLDENPRKRETEKQKLQREKDELNAIKTKQRELNPQLRDDKEQVKSTPKKMIGDGGSSWLRRAFKRAEEQAASTGKSIEEIAAQRWGSLENFQKLLAKAEGRSFEPEQRPESGTRKRSPEGQRHRSDNRHYKSRSRDKTSERKRSREREQFRSRSRSRERTSGRRRSRSRSDTGDSSRSRRRESRDRSRQSTRQRSRDRKRDSSSSSSSSLSSSDWDKRRRNRGSKSKFAKPKDDDGSTSNTHRSIYRPSASSSSSWKTSERQDREREEKFERLQEEMKREKPRKESSDSEQEEEKKVVREVVPEEEVVILSEKEMNVLGAKVIKAEMLGNTELAAKLKSKLEKAKQAKLANPSGPTGQVEEEEVVLTITDSKGMSRPIDSDALNARQPDKMERRRAKKAKVDTHELGSGKRTKYFADDDKYSLKQLFEREKLSKAEDQNGMMSRLAGKSIDKTNEDYDLDDVFTDRAAKRECEEKTLARERDKAIHEHKQMTKSLEECTWCLGGKNMKKHLMVAMGEFCYLAVPGHTSIAEGHCLIVPISHVSCSTSLDENVWAEVQHFRKALVRMFNTKGANDDNEDEDCVFYELAVNLRRNPHMVLECVPLPKDIGNMAPMYFQKAIQECESEWSHNKKLISLREKDVRRSVPKGLPYFHVDFGLEDGFAHVIEDEQDFPKNFAQEIIGGMLDLDPRFWRNPKRENFEVQKHKVIKFGSRWKDFDFTKKLKQHYSDSTSSSSSDSE